jgi:hypothetical protein
MQRKKEAKKRKITSSKNSGKKEKRFKANNSDE